MEPATSNNNNQLDKMEPVTSTDTDQSGNTLSNRELALKILKEKTSLCFTGGGILGFAIAGAIVRLYELGGLDTVDHAVGSSVGSLIALALVCKATPYYIEDKIMNMDLNSFQDGGNIIFRAFRFLFRYGIHKGDQIEVFAGEILKDLTGNDVITLQEIHNKYNNKLTITYLSTLYKKTKYADHITDPVLQGKTIARWSSGIPLFFKGARRYTGVGCYNKRLVDIISDGGIADIYPLHILREQGCNPVKILGFKFYNNGENANEEKDYGNPKNIAEYGWRLVDVLREQALKYHVHKEDWKLTCKINVGKYKTTDFNLTREDKLWLYNSVREAMDNHLKDIEELLDRGEYPL